MNYHGRMMNIQCVPGRGDIQANTPENSYLRGHCAARHAAAKIATEADTEIEKFRKLLTKALPLIEAEAERRDMAMHGDSDKIYTAGDYWTEMRELANEIAELLR